ncbi:MAG: DinB family protein [Gemmatimonadota bacterium]
MFTLPKDPRVTLIAGELARVMADCDAILDTLPASAMDVAPEGQWSPVQIIWHLSKVQHWVTRGIEQGVAALPRMATIPPGPSPDRLLESMDRFPIRDRSRKVEAPEVISPPRGLDLAEERTRWQSGRAELLTLLERTGLRLTIVQATHPMFGPLDGWQFALFVARHEERHLDQLRELLASRG